MMNEAEQTNEPGDPDDPGGEECVRECVIASMHY